LKVHIVIDTLSMLLKKQFTCIQAFFFNKKEESAVHRLNVGNLFFKKKKKKGLDIVELFFWEKKKIQLKAND